MSSYLQILQDSDSRARTNFQFDPRVAFATESSKAPPPKAENQGASDNTFLSDPAGFMGVPEGSHTDQRVAQAAPTMREEKRYVVVDSGLRDWTVYSNAYSNLTFAFGDGALDKPRTPVYTNNATYPSFALPPTNNPTFQPTPGAANTRGFSYLTPGGTQVDLSAYNSSLPKGNFLTYDTSLNVQNNAGAFGCPLTPSNVVGIRLVRALLPQTPFVQYPSDPIFNTSLSGDKAAGKGNLFYTFSTYPYLLFFVNDYRGQYYAPTEAGRRSFAVLTQSNRSQIDFSLSNGPQYFDYTPWNQEVLRFQSPLTTLQKLQLTVTDANGNVFGISQPDDLAVESIRLATNVDASGNIIGQPSRATLMCVTPAYNTYLETQLRVGDSIIFHGPTIDLIAKSDALANSPSKVAFAKALKDRSFPILSVQRYQLNPDTNNWYPVQAGIDITDSTVDYFNVFFIPNITTRDNNGAIVDLYPDAVDSGSYEILNTTIILGAGNHLPLLNSTQQPVYTFELDVVTPDTTNIGGKPVF